MQREGKKEKKEKRDWGERNKTQLFEFQKVAFTLQPQSRISQVQQRAVWGECGQKTGDKIEVGVVVMYMSQSSVNHSLVGDVVFDHKSEVYRILLISFNCVYSTKRIK